VIFFKPFLVQLAHREKHVYDGHVGSACLVAARAGACKWTSASLLFLVQRCAACSSVVAVAAAVSSICLCIFASELLSACTFFVQRFASHAAVVALVVACAVVRLCLGSFLIARNGH